jgi:predicted nucleic acid-binding protein
VTLHAPELLDIEVLQVLRRFEREGSLSPERARECLEDFGSFLIERYPHHLLLDRAWELRANLTAYDAAYVTLAELLRAPLLTCDSRLARAPHGAHVQVLTG